jgi:hypothetical protein
MGQKPRAKKTDRTLITPETRAVVTALENSGVSYSKIKIETGVNPSTAHEIVQRAMRLTSENNRPLLAPEYFIDDRRYIHRPRALTEELKTQIVDHVTASREHRNMQADELRRDPSLPNISTSTMEQSFMINGIVDSGAGRNPPMMLVARNSALLSLKNTIRIA